MHVTGILEEQEKDNVREARASELVTQFSKMKDIKLQFQEAPWTPTAEKKTHLKPITGELLKIRYKEKSLKKVRMGRNGKEAAREEINSMFRSHSCAMLNYETMIASVTHFSIESD